MINNKNLPVDRGQSSLIRHKLHVIITKVNKNNISGQAGFP